MKYLSQGQIDEFDEKGYLFLHQWIPVEFVDRVRKAAESALDLTIKNAKEGTINTDTCVTWANDEPYVGAIIHPHRYMYPASLGLLGSPWVLGIAESLCGKGCMTTYKALVVKNRGNGSEFTWHQDMVHDRTSRIVNISVFLSEASSTDDGLQVVPGTQLKRQDMSKAKIEAEKRAICLGAVPGDVTIHDVMTVHGSKALTQRERRLVFTSEFRTREHIQNNSNFPAEWVSAREELQDLERSLYEQMVSSAAGLDSPDDKATEIIEKFCGAHSSIEPGNYDTGHDMPLQQ